jgi:hypothetical protein
MHQHLYAVGSPVGEQVGVMRAGGTEDAHHTGQRSLGPRTHIQWFDGQPHRVDTDHRSSSRIQTPKSAAADTGHVIVIAVAPRRSWIRMSHAFAGGNIAGSDTGTNSPVAVARAGRASRAGCRQRCTTLALIPCNIATLATDAPGASHSANTCACNSAL